LEDRFTEEELQIAKSVDLVRVAESMGFTPKRVGNYYTLKEMDSIRIYDRSNWFRWSRQFEKGQNGGSQIDFLRVFAGMDVKTAVFWLLDFSGYRRMEEKESFYHLKNQVEKKEPIKKKPFVLPRPSDKNLYLYQYLQKERGLRKEVIDYFLEKGLIYESQDYHNIVFKGNASDGTTKFASMRGVFDRNRKPFKCDVAGNDKNYGFNVANKESSIVIVFEGAIDLMSYVDIFSDYETNKIALGMLADAPLGVCVAVIGVKMNSENGYLPGNGTADIAGEFVFARFYGFRRSVNKSAVVLDDAAALNITAVFVLHVSDGLCIGIPIAHTAYIVKIAALEKIACGKRFFYRQRNCRHCSLNRHRCCFCFSG